MKIKVKLISPRGTPRGFDKFGDAVIDLAQETTITGALERFDLSRQMPYMTLVNGESIVESERAAHRLSDGDELTIFPPIQGGSGGFGRVSKRHCHINCLVITEVYCRCLSSSHTGTFPRIESLASILFERGSVE